MNRNWKQWVLVLVFILGLRCLFGQTALPTNWWQGMPTEEVWKKAETITSELAFLRGIKKQLRNDPDSGFEHLQRRTADGFVETKITSKNNKFGRQQVAYQNKEGHWLTVLGDFTLKLEFGENADTEKRIAKSIQQPYAYRLMEPVLVGTNACIVVSRTMTAPLFDACLEDHKNRLSREQAETKLRDGRQLNRVDPQVAHLQEQVDTMTLDSGQQPGDHISFEKQCFIRQWDGVVMGCLEYNESGSLRADHLNDVIWVNQPIPEREFIVPKSANTVTDKSIEDFKKAFKNKLHKEIIKTKTARARERERKLSIALALAVMGIVGFGSLLWRFRRGTGH